MKASGVVSFCKRFFTITLAPFVDNNSVLLPFQNNKKEFVLKVHADFCGFFLLILSFSHPNSVASIPHHWSSLAGQGEHQPTTVSDDHLCARSHHCQVSLLVLPGSLAQGEEGERRDCGDQGDSRVGREQARQELWCVVAIQFSYWLAQHVPRVPGRERQSGRYLVL